LQGRVYPPAWFSSVVFPSCVIVIGVALRYLVELPPGNDVSLRCVRSRAAVRRRPASSPRTHILLGIGLSGVTRAFIQSGIILVFGLLIGVSFFRDLALPGLAVAVAGIFLFLGAFSLGFIFFSSAIAMRMESHEGLQGMITLLSMPLFFTSNALYPVEAFPPLLKAISLVNPLTYLVNGIRYFAIGDHFYAFGTEYLYATGDILVSFLALAAFALLMFAIALHMVKRMSLV